MTSYNQRPANHGGQKYFSGLVSQNNTIGPVTKYYEGRESPIRKSIAYSPPRQVEYLEVPGQPSQDFALYNNNPLYQSHAEKT